MGAWCRSMAISTITPAGWSTIARAGAAGETAPGAPSERTDKRAQRQAAAALRQQLAPHKREADKLERELGGLHEKLAASRRGWATAPCTTYHERTNCASCCPNNRA